MSTHYMAASGLPVCVDAVIADGGDPRGAFVHGARHGYALTTADPSRVTCGDCTAAMIVHRYTGTVDPGTREAHPTCACGWLGESEEGEWAARHAHDEHAVPAVLDGYGFAPARRPMGGRPLRPWRTPAGSAVIAVEQPDRTYTILVDGHPYHFAADDPRRAERIAALLAEVR